MSFKSEQKSQDQWRNLLKLVRWTDSTWWMRKWYAFMYHSPVIVELQCCRHEQIQVTGWGKWTSLVFGNEKYGLGLTILSAIEFTRVDREGWY